MQHQILELMFKGENPRSVFEIGCAKGGLLKDISDHYQDLVVGGMEISTCVEDAKKTFPKFADNFLQGSIIDPWPVADKSYDIVFSVGVLMYIFEPMVAMKEMLRVGKTVILAEYHHQELDIYGHLTKGYMDNGRIHTGIIRNYVDIFKMINIPMQIMIQDSGMGKTIIKCIQNG